MDRINPNSEYPKSELNQEERRGSPNSEYPKSELSQEERRGPSPNFESTKSECSGAKVPGAAGRPYDLTERTALFGEAIIRFAKRIPITPVTQRLIPQFVAAGTSVGANYCEADDAVSRKDFRHKIGICRKESKETKYWLRMVVVATPELRDEGRVLWQEAKELNLIFGRIRRSTE
ncbi:MAG TPA: four helix bundle protein [Tepidisphaeraceae bacterium]|nr:four helix bundle protein [Tepidisphaeraceae bacterium]